MQNAYTECSYIVPITYLSQIKYIIIYINIILYSMISIMIRWKISNMLPPLRRGGVAPWFISGLCFQQKVTGMKNGDRECLQTTPSANFEQDQPTNHVRSPFCLAFFRMTSAAYSLTKVFNFTVRDEFTFNSVVMLQKLFTYVWQQYSGTRI